MTAAATDMRVLVQELMPLLAMLWALVPTTGAAAPAGGGHHVTGSPAPWHPEAGPLLYTISEEARRLEASLRREVTGHTGERRGGSDANTVAALDAIVALSYGVPEASARRAGAIVSRWIRSARQVTAVGLEARPTRIPVPPGQPQPPCPYCNTFSLRVLPHDRAIWCINGDCTDLAGRRPRGRLGYDHLGDPMIVWDDGHISRRQDLA
ncbi:hypothetical protein MF672_010770 [Actinomadura sp. ATCC 31491]|uniref:Secreted protein n=1 Tax=Actinomadura luzonensis TaxID=2805427 RepID=A0ABT0FPK9_9ACTN|nr:hypothetical protein [Actinomadura luzonensis]MCK2214269.1 hypothetical protein [Actinomadura luzonensis]